MAETIVLKLKAIADMQDVLTNAKAIESALKSWKVPDTVVGSFSNTIKSLETEIEKYKSLMEKGFNTKTDISNLAKSGNEIVKLVKDIEKAFKDIDPKMLNNLIPPELNARLEDAKSKVESLTIALETTQKQTPGFKDALVGALELAKKKAQESGEVIENLSQKIGARTRELNGIFKNIELGNFDEALKSVEKFEDGLKKVVGAENMPDGLSTLLDNLKNHINTLATQTTNADNATKEFGNISKDAYGDIEKIIADVCKQLGIQVDQVRKNTNETLEGAKAQKQFNSELDSMKGKIQYFFGLNNAINLFKRGIREAFNTIKELDKVMTATAVVTDFSVGDMWDQLPEYTQRANELGISTKAAYEAATLFYQQGLKTNEVVALSNETLKMARIAGLDAAIATDRMTNALRGFNMELNEMSAQRVNDVYSQLAAKSASDVDEISKAMTKVASLAHSAGMEFETTSAFLAQIIETTRESAETAGTALKTIVARFSEVKKLMNEGQLSGKDSEGEAIDVNKVQAALRTAGVDMTKFFLGEEGLDQVFLELASKWDSLTTVQQRFIATQAAGSRQQSRFIAMMQDYARTQELVGLAYDANGASAEQFAKTQDSLESKLARLKNAWDEFLMGLTNSDLVKGFVDLLTTILNGINKLTKGFDKGSSSVLKWAAALGTIVGGKALFGGKLGNAILSDVGNSFLGQLFGLGKGAKGESGVIALLGQVGDKIRGVATEATVAGKTLTMVGTGAAAAGKVAAVSWAGVATTLGIVAAAIAAVSAAYLIWRNNTEQGELKQRETWANSAHNTLNEINNIVKEQQSTLDTYKKYTDQLDSTVFGSPERDAAIKERNQYILDLIEQDKTYSQYLQTTFDNGKMILSFDEGSLTAAIAAGIQASRVQEYITGMSDAAVADQNLKIQQQKLAELETRTLQPMYFAGGSVGAYQRYGADYENIMAQQGWVKVSSPLGGTDQFVKYRDVTPDRSTEIAKVQTLIEQYTKERNALTEAALSNLVVEGTDSDLASVIIRNLTSSIDWNKFDISWEESKDAFIAGKTRQDLESQFKSLYPGMESAQLNNLKDEDLARSIFLFDELDNLLPGVIDKFDQLAQVELDTDTLNAIKLLNGSNSSSIDWSAPQTTTVGEGKHDIVINGKTIDLQSVQEATGIDYDTLISQYEEQQKAGFKAQKTAQEELRKSLASLGVEFDARLLQWLSHATVDDVTKSTSFIDSVSKTGLISSSDQAELFKNLPSIKDGSIKSIMQFNENFSLDSPIAAFGQLQAAMDSTAAHGSKVFSDYLQSVAEANKNTLSLTAMFDEVVKADSFEDVAKALAKINEKEKDITAADIKEVAASSAELNKLLSYGIDGMGKLQINATGVARAMNAWQQGKITLDQITGGVLETLSTLETVEDEIARIEDIIANFNPGPDYGEGSDFIIKWVDKAKEYIENYEFGNPILEGIYDQLFGSGAYEKIMAEAEGDLEKTYKLLTDNINQLSKWAANNSEEFMHEAITNMSADWQALGVSYEQSVGYIWEVGTRTTKELIEDIMKVTGASYDSASMILEGWLAQSYQTRKELEENDIVAGILKDLESGTLRTIEDFETLGATVGKTFDELQELAKERGIELKIDFVDKDGNLLSGEDLTKALDKVLQIDSSNIKSGQFYEYAEEYLEKFSSAFDTKANTVNLSGLINDLITEGMTPEQAQEAAAHILGVIQKAFDEEGPGKELKLRPQFIFADSDGNADAIIRNFQEEFETVNLVEIHANTDPLVEDIQQAITDLKTSTGGLNIDEALAAGPLDKFQRLLAESADSGARQAKIDDIFKEKTSTAIQAGITQARVDQVLAEGRYEDFRDAIKTSIEAGAKGVSPDAIAAAFDAAKARIAALIKQSVQEGIQAGAASANPTVNVKTQTTNIMQAEASGGYNNGSAWALTGEEGAEIVWNKEAGYSYITGRNGPQFQYLQPGDRIFNAQETSRILRSSRNPRDKMESYGSGGYRPKTPTPGGGSYDTVVAEDPVTVETSEPVTVETPSTSSSGSDYVKQSTWRNDIDWLYNLVEDISELERQQNLISEKHDLYLKSIDHNGRDLLNLTSQELSNLLTQYDNQATMQVRRLQEMNELMLQNTKYSKYVWWNQQDNTLEIDWDKIEAIRNKETYDEVKDLISRAEQIQSQIDEAESAMSSLSASIQEIKTRYLQAYLDFQSRVLNAVVAQYQKTIDNLSILNDTLNESNQAILESIRNEIDLQRQIRDNTDTEKNIADMEQRLAYLMRDTSGANQAEILSLQKQLEDEREKYSDTLIDQAVERLQDQNDKAAEQREQQIELLTSQLEFWQETGELWNEVADLMSNGFSADGALIGGSQLEQVLRDAEGWQAMSQAQRENWANELILATNQVGAYLLQISEGLDSLSAGIWASLPAHSYTSTKSEGGYASGGLTSRTSYAMLHGTPSEPEYVLNARQTDAFLRLTEVLPNLLGGSGGTTTNYGGTANLYFSLHVDQIASDYDVDRIADRVKDIIYETGAYRNVNVLHALR